MSGMEATQTTTRTPVEIDTELSALHTALATIEQKVAWAEDALKGAAGAKYYYVGRRRTTDMDLDEAVQIVSAALAEDKYSLNGYTIRSYSNDRQNMVERYETLLHERVAAMHAINEAEKAYTGWSRFFLVTSSKGHIHSWMGCSTCRPTTTFGWLPSLSGRTEAEAVEECGPALCSVCFPSAPVEWTTASLTKAQAEKKAAAQ